MKTFHQTWLLGITGALLVFYFVFDITINHTGGVLLIILWIVSFCMDICSTFEKPELFSFESNAFLVLLCEKSGKIIGCILLGGTELLLIGIVTILFTMNNFDWMSFCVIAACVGNFHLLWFVSNRQFTKNQSSIMLVE